ncbi:unnamed protein product [Ectocarpus sp. 13 AM-2016]
MGKQECITLSCVSQGLMVHGYPFIVEHKWGPFTSDQDSDRLPMPAIVQGSGVRVTICPFLRSRPRCSGMPEDSKAPFCRDGGCYNCEVEVVEAAELGIVDNLVRACQFKIPAEAKQLTLIQMTSEEAFEDML